MKNGLHADKNGLKTQYQPSSLNPQFTLDINNPSPPEISAYTQNNKGVSRLEKKSLLQKFYNLSINRKQLIALIVSEAITILGISIVGRGLISNNLQTLSLEQAKSELAVTDINNQETLKATVGSYSAVYLRQPTGEFALATDLNQAQADLNLPQEGKYLLEAASMAEGKVVTSRIKLGNNTYAMAAKAVPSKIIETDEQPSTNFDEKSVAILVRLTPETALNQLLKNYFWLELFAIILALTLILFWTFVLRRGIVQPIQQLEQTANKFATGDRSARSEVFANDEIGQLANIFNQIADRITQEFIRQENEARLTQIVNEITARFRGSLKTTHILNVAVTSIREAIKTDRVIVYRFDENWQGKIIAESVGTDWPQSLGKEIADPCFANEYVYKYQNGRVQALENIYAAGLTECHLEQLEQFAIKANLVAPILLDNKLYGLLIAHQCSGTRNWQKLEIELLTQVAIPVGYALEQSYLLEQVDTARSYAEATAIEQSQQNEALQQQILTLLRDIEGASQGDLTVRSEVISGELGTVADFFNSIVESLRAIVTKVKTSAIQVNSAIGENEVAIRQLAKKALQQADDISLSLVSIDQMKSSIESVAENARKAALVAHTASCTAEENGEAMDLAVQNILKLRSTIGDTAKKVKRLGESSQQISHVVALIEQIAMQTNFLAINAGLEATRSGIEGEGFAIIAEEVASLAGRCSDATKEIAQIVEKIQRETNEVITAMELGTNQVVEGTNIIENAKSSLSQILNVSKQIDDLVQSIFLATASQVETSQAVSKLMQEISQVSVLTSDYSRQASQSLKQTVEISQELQAAVETFKVN
ncbi:MAG: methyl-accepting chemotaxis protein [Aulosira sp. ZfuVER01]|nr:methyl-accepting chemotaxis protein [Aulosira sp. ZfuVER01]MDZ7997861.1 methyl-accepting chemotaxis protein [Aulosira sp. DedVER01a]MDZ8052355.1 methyl-accepting chemotaxis protein [Aulosira sp. ZfuCHP01]